MNDRSDDMRNFNGVEIGREPAAYPQGGLAKGLAALIQANLMIKMMVYKAI